MKLEQQFERLIRTIQLIGEEPWEWNVPRLAHEFGVGTATVERDIRILRHWGTVERKNGCFAIGDAKFLSPSFRPLELVALVLAWRLVGENIQIPLPGHIHAAIAKIRSALPKRMNTVVEEIERRLTVDARFTRDIDPAVLNTASMAISNRNPVVISYYVVQSNPTAERHRVDPYGLTFRYGLWYVVGYSHTHRKTRTFSVAKIQEIKTVNERFEYPEHFDLEEYLKPAWRVHAHADPEHVVLRFGKSIAPWIAGCKFHPTQKISMEKDGSALFEVTVAGVDEIKHWVLTHGDKVEVLEPESLRAWVAEVSAQMAQRYASPCGAGGNANNR